jgi:hypothetical protein
MPHTLRHSRRDFVRTGAAGAALVLTGATLKGAEQIPKGTKLAWIDRWDNSADNPANPDPSKEVRWGLQTWDEMHNGWMETLRRRIDKPKSTTP